MEEFYKTGAINSFNDPHLKQQRKDLISESIGFGDGLNHVRVMKSFKPFIKKRAAYPKRINFKHLRLFVLMNIGKFFFYKPIFKSLPGFKKAVYVFENRHLGGLINRRDHIYQNLKSFHKASNINLN